MMNELLYDVILEFFDTRFCLMALPSAKLNRELLLVPAARWLLRPVPKAASTALKRLAVISEGRTPPERASAGETRPALAVHDPRLHGLSCLGDASLTTVQEVLFSPDWLRLAITRHPAERLLSFWHDKLHLAEPAYLPLNSSIQSSNKLPADNPCRFADFLIFLNQHWEQLKTDGHLCPQVDLLEPEAISYTHILDRKELVKSLPALLETRLSPQSFITLQQELGIYDRSYRQRLSKRWEDAFSEEAIGILAKLYANDLYKFNYKLPNRRGGWVKPLSAVDLDALVDPLQQLRDRNNQIAGLQHDLALLQQQLAESHAHATLSLPRVPGESSPWPDHNDPEAGLSQLYMQLSEGNFQEVLHLAGAIESDSNNGEVAYLIGVANHMLGLHEIALTSFESAQDAGFLTPYLLFNAGNACRGAGNLDDGLRLYREALLMFPAFPECRHNLSLGLIEAGNIAEAELELRRLLRDQPSYYQASFCLANILRDKKQIVEAIEAFRLCIQFAPCYPDAWNNLGLAQAALGKHDEAIACYRQALSIDAKFKPSRQNLAQGLVQTKQHEHALEEFEYFSNLVLADNERVVALQGRINCLLELDRYDDAVKLSINCSVDRRLQLITSCHVLPVLFHSEEQLEEVRSKYTQDLNELYPLLDGLTEDDPAFPVLYTHAWSLTNFYLAYQMGNDRPLQELYAGILDRILRPKLGSFMDPLPQRDPTDTSPIRVGVISPYLKNHNGAIWSLGWLEGIAHDPDYAIYSYNLGEDEDSGTARFATLGTYRHLPLQPEMPDPQLQQIRDDKLDLLIFTDIGMHPASKITSVLQLAPVQAQGWGHPITSGSATIQYFFGSEGMEPPGNEHHYSETLIRLPGTGLNYETPVAIHDGHVLYERFHIPQDRPLLLSLQSTFKYAPRNDWTIAEIARRHPQALILLVGHMGHGSIVERLQNRLLPHFEKNGLILEDHLRILPRLDHADFMGLFAIGHHTIDTIDWNGGNSSLQSLSLDCPVVTYPTEFMRGRHTVAMLEKMNLPELIATDRDSYISISIKLLEDMEFYGRIKHKIKERKACLFNDKSVAESFRYHVDKICLRPPKISAIK